MVEGAQEPVASTSSSHILDPSALLSRPGHLSLSTIKASLDSYPNSVRLITATNLVLGGRVYDQTVLRKVIEIGQNAGEESKQLLEEDLRSRWDSSDEKRDWSSFSAEEIEAQVEAVVGSDGTRLNMTRCLVVLQQARRRIDTYDAFYPPKASAAAIDGPTTSAGVNADDEELDLSDPWAENNEDDDLPPMLDDPWADQANMEKQQQANFEASPEPDPSEPPLDASTFILQALTLSALNMAASAHLHALRVVCQRHSAELWPYRLAIVEAIPAWAFSTDSEMMVLLPALQGERESEVWPKGKLPDKAQDLLDRLAPRYGLASISETPSELLPSRRETPLTGEDLSAWYLIRVTSLDDLGLLDSQLAWVQHGASLGIQGLDAVGEDLSLLSRLIYDANLPPADLEKWSLARWKRTSEDDIVRTYLSSSTPESIVDDIRRLILPYLYVLESRAERAGKPDAGIVERMLNNVILDLPLSLALPCFEASKATLRGPARLIKDDQTVARLALACLYGSEARDSWAIMSAIFECLPVWDVSGGDLESDKEATATTLESIASFIRPSVSSNEAHGARHLFIFFKPLPFSSLSRALDILDVHLESGEILARWDVRVYLSTLLQSATDSNEQITLAEKMVRRQRGIDERRWMQLWEDMCKLQGGDDQLLRGAFGMLPRKELMRIFLGGLLSSGNFVIAKKIIRRLEPEGYFTPAGLEDSVLTTSREFYMRAETGNIYSGDMKLANDCLSVAPPSRAIHAEQDFIQATSRLCSFATLSNMTPAEIRYTPNKLDLIRRVLSTSDAYKHGSIILELTEKLGLTSQSAQAEVLAMLSDAATSAQDWDLARERVEKLTLMASPDLGQEETEEAKKVRDVAWRSCLALGRQATYPDLAGRMALLAQAVALAPADQVSSILQLYKGVEDELTAHPEALRAHIRGKRGDEMIGVSHQDTVLGSRRAARAAKLALDIGSNLPGFGNLRSMTVSPALGSARSVRSERSERSLDRRDTRDGRESAASGRESLDGARDPAGLFDQEVDVRAVGRRALVKGVGWLLGADEDVA